MSVPVELTSIYAKAVSHTATLVWADITDVSVAVRCLMPFVLEASVHVSALVFGTNKKPKKETLKRKIG
jgi:hypothetical protein